MGNAAEPESSQTYDVSTPTPTAIANLFNRYFTSVFNSDHDKMDPPSSPPSTSG